MESSAEGQEKLKGGTKMIDTMLGLQNYFTTQYFWVTFIIGAVVSFVGCFIFEDR